MDNLPRMNPINLMSNSGARGNVSNFTQLAGMRGLMGKPVPNRSPVRIRSFNHQFLSIQASVKDSTLLNSSYQHTVCVKVLPIRHLRQLSLVT